MTSVSVPELLCVAAAPGWPLAVWKRVPIPLVVFCGGALKQRHRPRPGPR